MKKPDKLLMARRDYDDTLQWITEDSMMKNKQRRMSIYEVRDIVSQIDLGTVLYDRPSFVVMSKGDGYLLQLMYREPDVDAPGSEPVIQSARKWYISPYATDTEIVRTAYKAVLASLEHRLGEHFLYNGKRIYSPHISVEALATVCDSTDTRTPK